MVDSVVTLIGNVTRDVELRYTASGQAVVSFGLAVNRKWQDKQTNEWKEQASFIDVSAWGTLADNVSESLEKGARVIVTGRIEQQSWEAEDGTKRSKIQVVADGIGPDLRWATCQVFKAERTGGNADPGAYRPPAAPTAAPTAPKPAPMSYDEEPF